MGFFGAIQSCVSKYATLSGRAPLSELWYWYMFQFLIMFILGVLVGFGYYGGPLPRNFLVLVGIFLLVTFLPTLAVSVRRFHDMDRTGWWILIELVPNIGFIVAFFWYMVPGTDGDNRFGPRPLGG